ncbi:YchJ family protein [Rhodococcus sp. IEGM 1379]|uniref:YchJ family protein n=1 Tax=Rhodococcus sp. IEGM 1379 TaxID=3047086 RepID=UPI0024B7B3C7|nr:YchJ family protein [Rhodococcus sp. IEGM 1379]MDI9915752.1 YchJ family protein [Rhodococcus sp. IEGM 1379]
MTSRRPTRFDPSALTPTSPCPCGSGNPLGECCGRYLSGQATAPTAETLMRSRYTAFAVLDTEYLLRTWHSDHRPSTLDLDTDQQWTRLEILDTERGSLFDSEGIVEFSAHYSFGREHGILHERSRFERIDGQWLYVDGDID